ncbi:hypothetical protein MR642_08105 [bacterium]|nr:hypothetical protein [bacterium]
MGAKIVQGERRTKEKATGFFFFMPSRSLSYQKIVQGERRTKNKAERFVFLIPSRSLSYQKIVQDERRTKEKATGSFFFMPSRSLSYAKIMDFLLKIRIVYSLIFGVGLTFPRLYVQTL